MNFPDTDTEEMLRSFRDEISPLKLAGPDSTNPVQKQKDVLERLDSIGEMGELDEGLFMDTIVFLGHLGQPIPHNTTIATIVTQGNLSHDQCGTIVGVLTYTNSQNNYPEALRAIYTKWPDFSNGRTS